MSYVGEPFRHDIFVSYSHGTAADGVVFLAEWSENFVRALEAELRFESELRDALRIFLDRDQRPDRGVDPMAELPEQLKAEVEASALLMVLMSPDYLKSSWCQREREWWSANQHEPNLATSLKVPVGFKPQERVAVIRMRDPQAPWPPPLADADGTPLVGFPFEEDLGGIKRPLGWRLKDEEFAKAVLRALMPVVSHVKGRLDKMRERLLAWQAEQAQLAKLQAEGGQTLYLHGRSEQAPAWERAAMRLNDFGFLVVPAQPDPVLQDPVKEQQVREQRVRDLADCDALLLLATDDGRALDSDLAVVGKHDRHSARSRFNKLLPLGVVDTAGPVIATPVRRNNARILQANWVDARQDDWPAQLPPWLAQQGGAEARP
ncbi:TIR domain-containing protein [Ramlibacter alkalitolerans]|uniref:TIR domain-containing protein n=1 Tax=Ramlibacter alkalitolerans TaxID=2039631 RepID=A0ABS1JRQ9_9BURK|nr:TIR domain-containing protein [Ramlibacter alkalitolerans]MBL0426950.1 TIR domain-containing protein [Ramlibacter alkalitolerans]